MKEWAALDMLLSQPGDSAFAGEFAALRGDMAMAQGDREAARAAYADALARGVENPDMLRMKLVDVGGAPAAS